MTRTHTHTLPPLGVYVSCAQVKEGLQEEALGKLVQVRAHAERYDAERHDAECHDASRQAAPLHGMARNAWA